MTKEHADGILRREDRAQTPVGGMRDKTVVRIRVRERHKLRIGSDAYPETALCHCSGPAEARVRNRVSVGAWEMERGRTQGWMGVKWVKQVRSAPASSCEDDAENDGGETERAAKRTPHCGLRQGA